jgi:hypothetical protein
MQVENSYSRWTLPELRTAISMPRMSRYERLANGDAALAMRLYHWNSALSEALHCPLLSLEITLRNAVNERLRAAYGDAWYDSPSVQLNDAHIQQVREAKDYLRRARKKVDAPGIISKLSLGFWVGLFSSRYETPLWRNHLRWIFTRAPKSLLRDTVYRRLERMRRLRNRVAHHEPILHLPLTDEYCSILNTIEWLCLATALYTARQSHFPSVFENRPQPTCHSHLTAESQSADP